MFYFKEPISNKDELKQSFKGLKITDTSKKTNQAEKKIDKKPDSKPFKPKTIMEKFNLHSSILDNPKHTILDAKMLQQAVTSNFRF